jgi:hypothetical protein
VGSIVELIVEFDREYSTINSTIEYHPLWKISGPKLFFEDSIFHSWWYPIVERIVEDS